MNKHVTHRQDTIRCVCHPPDRAGPEDLTSVDDGYGVVTDGLPDLSPVVSIRRVSQRQ